MTEIALVGEVVEEEQDNDVFQVTTRLNKMTWGDQMIHARFQLLIETIGDLDSDSDEADEDARKIARIAALKELVAGFDELTRFLDRVAKVTRNGIPIPMKDVPQDFITDVMTAISKQRGRRASKN